MNPKLCLTLHNGQNCAQNDIPHVPITEFRQAIISSVHDGCRIIALLGQPMMEGLRLYAVLADDRRGLIAPITSDVQNSYPALTPECPQVHWFEREIFENWRVEPENHPWLKPIRFIAPGRNCEQVQSIVPGVTEYYRVEGEEIHEVAVGPVHAGVIEPGHFRFQCHGENVFHLEISLGYQHRGIEKKLPGGPDKRTIFYMETLAGDTTVGHTLAYSQVLESLAGCEVSARGQSLRGIALELERLANHTGDLGALANDVGFLPTASYCGRIRGDFLNMTALVCGSRFGRGWIRPGGVDFDVDENRIEQLQSRLANALRDARVATEFLWNRPSVLARFEETGFISAETACQLGLVGVAARACGIEQDIRTNFPCGISTKIPIAVWKKGDVYSRARVRWLEIENSANFIRCQLEKLSAGSGKAQIGTPASGRFVVSLVEGWRGEICHVAMTDANGRFVWYKIVDPSFHNWMGLAIALRNQQISDFPLCNKSFNLSYCGHDL